MKREKIPRIPHIPQKPKTGFFATVSEHIYRYRLFVTRHNNKIMALWASLMLAPLVYLQYQHMSGVPLEGKDEKSSSKCNCRMQNLNILYALYGLIFFVCEGTGTQ